MLATMTRCSVARRARQIRELKILDRRFRRWSEVEVWQIAVVTLAEFMAAISHYGIDDITICTHVSAAGGIKGFISATLATCGIGSSVSFAGRPMCSGNRPPCI